VIEIDRDYTRADDVLTWCRRHLDAKLGGPCLTVLKPAELLSAAAVKCIVDFAEKNKSQVCLVSANRIPVVQVVYMKSAPWNFQTSLARHLGCPNELCDSVVRQCGGDLRQLQLVASSASRGEQSLAMADPRYHAHFNLGDLLSGQADKVPEDSIVPFAVQSNVLQPGARQSFDDLDAMARFAADAVHLDTLGFDDSGLALDGPVVKLSLQTNHLLGRRVKIDSRMLPNVVTTREATRAAMLPMADIMLDGIRVEPAVIERIQVTVPPDSSLQFQIRPHSADSAQQQMATATSDPDGYTEQDMIRFIKLRLAFFHEGARVHKSNVVELYNSAISSLQTVDVPPEDSWGGWWFSVGVECLEWLLGSFEPLRLARLDLYKYWKLGDVQANVDVVYKIAGEQYSKFLPVAVPPWDVSPSWEPLPLEFYQEPREQAFDFESELGLPAAVAQPKPTVLRFWFAPDGYTLPDAQQLQCVASWSSFCQVLWTNLPADSVDQLGFKFDQVVRYTPPPEHAEVAPQFLKDLWQFRMAEHYDGAWCVDLDFKLVDKRKLPTAAMVVATEWVKTSGGQRPGNVVRPGIRCHLGLTKFPSGCPVAREIAETLEARLPELSGVTKQDSSRWMSNTLQVQEILIKRGYEFPFGPAVFVPWPLWMTTDRLGKEHFGIELPSRDEALASTATFSVWSGYPKFAIDAVNSALGNVASGSGASNSGAAVVAPGVAEEVEGL
jgi:hypothetical protein